MMILIQIRRLADSRLILLKSNWFVKEIGRFKLHSGVHCENSFIPYRSVPWCGQGRTRVRPDTTGILTRSVCTRAEAGWQTGVIKTVLTSLTVWRPLCLRLTFQSDPRYHPSSGELTRFYKHFINPQSHSHTPRFSHSSREKFQLVFFVSTNLI